MSKNDKLKRYVPPAGHWHSLGEGAARAVLSSPLSQLMFAAWNILKLRIFVLEYDRGRVKVWVVIQSLTRINIFRQTIITQILKYSSLQLNALYPSVQEFNILLS